MNKNKTIIIILLSIVTGLGGYFGGMMLFNRDNTSIGPESLRMMELLAMAETLPVSPFYVERGGNDPQSVQYFNLLKERETEVLQLSDEIYSSASLLQGQYESLGNAALDFFESASVSASDMEIIGDSIGNALTEMQSYAVMRESAWDVSKTAGQDPYITSSMQYMTTLNTLFYASELADNTILLIAQCMYLIDAYPAGDIAALNAAINAVNSHSDAMFGMMGKTIAIFAFLADLDIANKDYSHYVLTETVKESEQALSVLRGIEGDTDYNQADVRLMINALEISIRTDRILMNQIERELMAAPEQPYLRPVSRLNSTPAEIKTLQSMEGSVKISNLSYSVQGGGGAVSVMSSSGGYLDRIKDAVPAIAEGMAQTAVDTLKDMATVASAVVGFAGDVAVNTTEGLLSGMAFWAENAAAGVLFFSGEQGYYEFSEQIRANWREYEKRLEQGDSCVDAVTTVRDFLSGLDPANHSWEGNPLDLAWSKAYVVLRVAGLDKIEAALAFADKNTTPAERNALAINFAAGEFGSGLLKRWGFTADQIEAFDVAKEYIEMMIRLGDRMEGAESQLNNAVKNGSNNACNTAAEVRNKRRSSTPPSGNQGGEVILDLPGDSPSSSTTRPPASSGGHSIDLANGVIIGAYRWAEYSRYTDSISTSFTLAFTEGNRLRIKYEGTSREMQRLMQREDLMCSYVIRYLSRPEDVDEYGYKIMAYDGYVLEIIPDVTVSNEGVFTEDTMWLMIDGKDTYAISSDGNTFGIMHQFQGTPDQIFSPIDWTNLDEPPPPVEPPEKEEAFEHKVDLENGVISGKYSVARYNASLTFTADGNVVNSTQSSDTAATYTITKVGAGNYQITITADDAVSQYARFSVGDESWFPFREPEKSFDIRVLGDNLLMIGGVTHVPID